MIRRQRSRLSILAFRNVLLISLMSIGILLLILDVVDSSFCFVTFDLVFHSIVYFAALEARAVL